jgi:hypothetical protein
MSYGEGASSVVAADWGEERSMADPSLLDDLGRVDEPKAAQEYSEVLTQVATQRRAVIVRRDGEDLAAVIPLEDLELVREVLARQEAERLAAQINWQQARGRLRPSEAWFEGDEPKPFSG